MNNTNDKNNKLCIPCINQSVVTECGEEVTLPDYYPEVRRVVSTHCRVLPESLYDNGETAEQGGVVSFTVLYLGDDGSLAAFPLTCDYSAAVKLNAGGGDTMYSLDTTAENVTCRAIGPRRLSLKARLRTCATGEMLTDCAAAVTHKDGGTVTPAEKISVQSLENTALSMRRATGKLTGTVSGEFREKTGTKPIMCDGEIMITEAIPKGDSVTLRGEAHLWCMCFGGDGLYYKAVSKAPFEESISLERELSAGDARGWGRCASVTVKDSEDGTLFWDMEYDLECEAAENVTVTVATDMYSTMWMGNTVTDECESVMMLKCGNGRLTLSGSGGRSGSITVGDYAVGSFGKATCDRVDRSGGMLTASGMADIRIPVCGGGEVVEECVRLPFKYECDCPAAEGDISWRCDVSVIDSTVRLDEGQLHVTAELAISLFAAVRTPVRYVSGLVLDRGQTDGDKDCTVRLYYPEYGETAWDIAKKYRIPKNAVGEVSCDWVLIE